MTKNSMDGLLGEAFSCAGAGAGAGAAGGAGCVADGGGLLAFSVGGVTGMYIIVSFFLLGRYGHASTRGAGSENILGSVA
jgi:hypothetical protein